MLSPGHLDRVIRKHVEAEVRSGASASVLKSIPQPAGKEAP